MTVELTHLNGQTIAVFGLARSGLATVRAAIAGGAAVVAWDDHAAARSRADALGARCEPIETWNFHNLSSVVLSPGVPLTHPQPHPVVALAQAADVELICDIELLYRQIAGQIPIIGITGTNGKSTTTALLAHVFNHAGRRTIAAGNIGIPALDINLNAGLDLIALELSSYQLDLLHDFRPDVAIWINISPDHLDRHGSMAGYIAAKNRIFANQRPGDLAVIGIDEPEMAAVVAQLAERDNSPNICTVSVGQAAADVIAQPNGHITGLPTAATKMLDLTAYPSLRGDHNWQNALCVFAAGTHFDLEAAAMDAGMKTFSGLRHRMEILGHLGPVLVINDSKATNAEAAGRALSTFENIYWLAGGQGKEDGITALQPILSRISAAFLFGECAGEFASSLQGKVPVTVVDTLDQAVPIAAQAALADGAEEPVLLFSPAAASFDQFQNFEIRGEKFSELVTLLEGFCPTVGA